MYANSRNNIPRVAQRYGTIAPHTRHHVSVLVGFVVFCMHMYSFAGLIRRTPPPTFSDTAITDRHSDTLFSSSELTGCGYPGLLDRKNCSKSYHKPNDYYYICYSKRKGTWQPVQKMKTQISL